MNHKKKLTLSIPPKQYKEFHKKRWQKSELVILKNEFDKGERLKSIARKLGRTETAINKVLARSGIRTGNFSDLCLKKTTKTAQHKKMTDIDEVIAYLNTKQYKIVCTTDRTSQMHFNKFLYTINGMSVSVVRLLIIANKHRLEEGLPIFHIRDPEN